MTKDRDTVTYQFEIDADTWNEWKATVPREKSLHDRIREYIEADRDGRLTITQSTDDTTPESTPDEAPPADAPASSSSADADVLDAMDIPQGKDPDDALEAVHTARDYLETHGPASRREIVTGVMPDHPLGYDVPDLETGDRFRGAWWRRIIQPGLRALDDVEYRENHSDYRVP
jgi:hypothetical protein